MLAHNNVFDFLGLYIASVYNFKSRILNSHNSILQAISTCINTLNNALFTRWQNALWTLHM